MTELNARLEVAAEIVLLCLPLARSALGWVSRRGYLIICHLKVTPSEVTFRI
jgi:hypothetical protein